jgi:enhancer of mRNA-decapping protein 3
VVVILAGNHVTGARAIASARHLYSRGFKVLISVLDFSNPSVWHPQLAKHIHSLQALGRKAARIEGWRSTSGQIKKLEGPPVIIVDALLDGQRHADIRDEDLRTEAREMIDWANRSRAGVLSINIPSGFDNVNGSSSIVDGEPLAIRPEAVLALGVPVLGLLEAIREGEGSAWTVTAIDTGVNVVLGDREKVLFGADWSVNLRFVSGEVQA